MLVKLEEITQSAEQRICHIARVSNPSNQDNPDYEKLIRYCIEHKHWSVFEHAHITLEIETSLAIATQILRHRSFTFQQFSQRYSAAWDCEPIQFRKQAEKNRQSSAEPADYDVASYYRDRWTFLQGSLEALYRDMLKDGIARECARMVLPQATTTRLYMSGNVRSWIHYIQLRTQPDTQLEHREIAFEAQQIFKRYLPVIADALGW